MMDDNDELRAKINAETGKIGWKELERHFARGVVITVDGSLDLVEVAARFAEDDRAKVERWLTSGKVRRTTPEDAQHWADNDPDLWSVVVAPWVLVQEG